MKRHPTSPTSTEVGLVWDPHSWQDYLWWQALDRRIVKRINQLIHDGLWHPERSSRSSTGMTAELVSLSQALVRSSAAAEGIGQRGRDARLE